MTTDHTGPEPVGDADSAGGGAGLPCGRDRDVLLDQVADGRGDDRDDHQRRCVHCQAALAECERLWAPMRGLAVEQVRAPGGGIESALARIRGAIDDADYAVLRQPDGVTRIAARVVVVAARHSAQDVPGVRVALSENVIGRAGVDSGGSAGVAGASTAVEITLAADYGQPLHELADRVRHAVTGRIRHLTDLEPVEVTVVIDDVLG